MNLAGWIGVSMRALVLLLAILVALCATGLGPAMAMADEQGCSGPFCDIEIGCGQPIQMQTLQGSALHFVATWASGARLLPLAAAGTRTIDSSVMRVTWRSLGPISRAPPLVSSAVLLKD